MTPDTFNWLLELPSIKLSLGNLTIKISDHNRSFLWNVHYYVISFLFE